MYRMTRLVAWAVLAAMLGFGCSTGSKNAGGGDTEAEAEDESKVIPVRVQTVEISTFSKSIDASGSVESERDVTVMAETAGRVVELGAELGDRVEKGQMLARVDGEPYRIAWAAAEATFTQADVALKQAEGDYQRAKELYQTKDISEQMFDQARFAYERAKAALAQARAGKDKAARDLRMTSVNAPFSGRVARRMVKPGDMLGLGSPVVQLVDMEDLKVTVGIGEDTIADVSIGMDAAITIPTLRAEAFAAKVVRVGPKALQPTMTYPVELAFTEKPEGVRVGMVARASVVLEDGREGISVPLEILVDRFDRQYVYVVEDGKAVERRVKLGERGNRNVLISEGLAVGETIVVTGQNNLKDGSPVRIVE